MRVSGIPGSVLFRPEGAPVSPGGRLDSRAGRSPRERADAFRPNTNPHPDAGGRSLLHADSHCGDLVHGRIFLGGSRQLEDLPSDVALHRRIRRLQYFHPALSRRRRLSGRRARCDRGTAADFLFDRAGLSAAVCVSGAVAPGSGNFAHGGIGSGRSGC